MQSSQQCLPHGRRSVMLVLPLSPPFITLTHKVSLKSDEGIVCDVCVTHRHTHTIGDLRQISFHSDFQRRASSELGV